MSAALGRDGARARGRGKRLLVVALILSACGPAPQSGRGPMVATPALMGWARQAASIAAVPAIAPAFATPETPPAPVDLEVAVAASLARLPVADSATLAVPPWWDGDCNANRSRGAYRLGASYRGVAACGPQPGRSAGRLVRFFPGAWGSYEWHCTELVYRFMYLAYGVVPYIGNGDEVVDNYRPAYGGNLVKVQNGSGVMPSPGDVLSYTRMHASIVTRVDVDTSGNGTIGVLEQNAPNDGSATLAVRNWRIAEIKNWLHHSPTQG